MARTAADLVCDDDLFTTALSGYSMDEVDAYVEETRRRMRRLVHEVQRLGLAETRLVVARTEVARLTAELYEARPLSNVGLRVQTVFRRAERDVELLRRTAFEVLRTAYEQARAVRQQVEDEACTAVQDYEITLHHRRQCVQVEPAHVMQAAAEPRQTAAVGGGG